MKDGDVTNIATTATQVREIGGAMLFLNADAAQNALNTTAKFIQARVDTATAINAVEINQALDSLASADMLIDNLKNKQPVLHTMFKVALDSSEKLKSAAA